MDNKITIHYDFTDGTELSYGEAINCDKDFTTNCLEFFSTSNLNAVVKKKNGKLLAVKDLLDGKGAHCDKEIGIRHNIHKMLIAGAFKW